MAGLTVDAWTAVVQQTPSESVQQNLQTLMNQNLKTVIGQYYSLSAAVLVVLVHLLVDEMWRTLTLLMPLVVVGEEGSAPFWAAVVWRISLAGFPVEQLSVAVISQQHFLSVVWSYL